MSTTFPTLYKKTSTGKIQMWEVKVENATMISQSGQLDGKKIITTDVIKAGKNAGRSNATTAAEQAKAEAEARWTAKKKKGYVEKITNASNDIVDELIQGGFLPMLAKSYEKDSAKIKFPCAVQPKLDGIRAVVDRNSSLYSRTRKSINSVPHINALLAEKLEANALQLDGELYNHNMKHDFEKIVHIVRQEKTPDPEHKLVQYCIYDVPSDKPFSARIADLHSLKIIFANTPSIQIVETYIANNEKELYDLYASCMEEGYEGVMVRNLDAPYEYKRSFGLQKLKEFMDDEFEIVGMEEGRGKLAGHAGAFICTNNLGTCFKAKMSGELKQLKVYWDNKQDYIGKLLTVQFQGLTGANKVPRFPVGLRIREDL
jgi:DNA ligase-1